MSLFKTTFGDEMLAYDHDGSASIDNFPGGSSEFVNVFKTSCRHWFFQLNKLSVLEVSANSSA